MARKEQIIEILNKYQSTIPPLHNEGMIDPMDFHKIAYAILSLPLDVPSDKEIKAWALSCQHESQSYRLGKYDGAIRMRDEILKRNGKGK